MFISHVHPVCQYRTQILNSLFAGDAGIGDDLCRYPLRIADDKTFAQPQTYDHSVPPIIKIMCYSQTWRRRTAQKREEGQLKQLRAAMTQLELPDALEHVDR